MSDSRVGEVIPDTWEADQKRLMKLLGKIQIVDVINGRCVSRSGEDWCIEGSGKRLGTWEAVRYLASIGRTEAETLRMRRRFVERGPR